MPLEAGSTKESEDAADVEQHCLLFPTYATQHSRSGSKDPLDWNIRVRGWAFSKRSNRRKRLVMSMARKLAGVTKDNKVYETLESRFGMFLASNTQGACFSIQCIGAATTTRMELAGDPNSHDPTVDSLRHEFKSSDAATVAADAAADKAKVRKSLEETGSGAYTGLHSIQSHSTSGLDSPVPDPVVGSGTPLSKSLSPENQDIGGRWSKGAAFVVGAYRKYKPVVMAQVNGGSSLHRYDQYQHVNGCNPTDAGETETRTIPSIATHRQDSNDPVLSQSQTHLEDLGHGLFPTVQISSRPGGHFDGTLRISDENVETHRKHLDTGVNSQEGHHPRFLKLVAHHTDMTEPCHGIVNLIDPIGISVISDIDDTIKETNIAAGARIILQNTFLNDMQDVPGMSQVYKRWWKQGAAIHYVSNSPWQLIPSLLEFFHSYKFPPGSAHLRLHDSVLKTYFMTPGESKRRAIHEILTDFPERRFILVGDSGEIDMEIYTDVALEFPHQVFKIFIRDITSARLREMLPNTQTMPQRSRSFTSLIPRTHINAVASGLSYFTKQGAAANSTINISDIKGNSEDCRHAGDTVQDGKAITVSSSKEWPSSGYHPDRASQHWDGSKEEGGFEGSTTFSSLEYSASENSADTTPGGPTPPSMQPPSTVKNPFEIWQDRIEQCQRRLPEGMLTFFTEADVLERCSAVNDMFNNLNETVLQCLSPSRNKSHP
ncbi:hypothetical protein EMPS_06316 [Entomortierella parvispora]|uniref:Phosphatidate phosphatase APP1 catalytic domain-containing protein n=1 Tax=Entomortierella parvispora TaxID=205924 RepID=A0A9P3LXC7_9FUNG|nr:hypothetical protein EMPS_06316 [Entomortierella parvispora]